MDSYCRIEIFEKADVWLEQVHREGLVWTRR